MSASGNEQPMLTTREAAERLGVSIRAVLNWAATGKLASILTPGGGRRLYSPEAVEAAYVAMYGDQGR